MTDGSVRVMDPRIRVADHVMAMLKSSRRHAVWAAICGWCVTATMAGCSPGPSLERFPVTGTVTHDGRPVPQGAVFFEPTAAVGAIAATGFAVIENGSYRTPPKTSPGKGLYTVRIIGRDGTAATEKDLAEMMPGQKFLGQPLFRDYSTTMELTGSNDRLDFTVPVR